MKKILSISLAAIMISSLAACGNSSSTPQTKAVETQAETKAEETKAEETKLKKPKKRPRPPARRLPPITTLVS